MRCIERQWIREAMIRQSLVMRSFDTSMKSKAVEWKGIALLGIGEAWTGRAAERQRKDVTCKGDEWPGNAADMQGEETELLSNAMNRNS